MGRERGAQQGEEGEMDAETKRRVEETVLEILRAADMESFTEHKVRSLAADRLGLDLSLPARKRLVRRVVESFLLSQQQQQAAGEPQDEEAEDEEEEEEDTPKRGRDQREYDDEGDLILCRLSNKRRVTLQEFRGKMLVSIREYYEKDGKQLPTSKGTNLV